MSEIDQATPAAPPYDVTDPTDIALLDSASFEIQPGDGTRLTLVIQSADGRVFASVIGTWPDETYHPLNYESFCELDITKTVLEETSIGVLLRHTATRIWRKATRGY